MKKLVEQQLPSAHKGELETNLLLGIMDILAPNLSGEVSNFFLLILGKKFTCFKTVFQLRFSFSLNWKNVQIGHKNWKY